MYLNEKQVCVEGTLLNCVIYKRTENKCAVCEKNFYIDKDYTCTEHAEIQFCQEKSPINKN